MTREFVALWQRSLLLPKYARDARGEDSDPGPGDKQIWGKAKTSKDMLAI